MNLSGFWEQISSQLEQLTSARSADDVITSLSGKASASVGDAFFEGSGWSIVWFEAGYHWCMQAPDGSRITYVEGDIYRGGADHAYGRDGDGA
jgi:hypothetical protein